MAELEKIAAYIKEPSFLKGLQIPVDEQIHIEPLAQGEYHKNFVFVHPLTHKKLVLRVNYGSQMHLENQITYEAKALDLLAPSGRTPKVYFVDDTKAKLPQGILVMDFLNGRPLDYDVDLKNAMQCLSDVHATFIPSDNNHLISFEKPIYSILEECEAMKKVYDDYEFHNIETAQKINKLMKLAYQKAELLAQDNYQNVCINTELNNHNFIVNEETGFVSLIDWEKPLWGDPAQDLGHMLAPTTTFWKTDRLLSEDEIDRCIDDYIDAVGDRIELGDIKARTKIFLQVTCLRGITWCAMAWVEYQKPGRELKNEETFRKIEAYLSEAFLDDIEKRLLA